VNLYRRCRDGAVHRGNLKQQGSIDQDVLATRFADRMQFKRNYGQGTYAVLCGVKKGLDWRLLTQIGFRGMGSFGNGGAMRVAPLGAFFADQPLEVMCSQARLGAEVTHAHAEGIAGAIAVAAAAALAWQRRGASGSLGRSRIAAVRDAVPPGYTRDAIAEALDVSSNATIVEAAQALGNGSGVTVLCRRVSGWSPMHRAVSSRLYGTRWVHLETGTPPVLSLEEFLPSPADLTEFPSTGFSRARHSRPGQLRPRRQAVPRARSGEATYAGSVRTASHDSLETTSNLTARERMLLTIFLAGIVSSHRNVSEVRAV
jgi:ADP-ribosylglycohydrolase